MKPEDVKVGELVTSISYGGIAIITNIELDIDTRKDIVDIYWIKQDNLWVKSQSVASSWNMLTFTTLFNLLSSETR